MDRRRFLETSAVATAGLGSAALFFAPPVWAYSQSDKLAKFITPLRKPGSAEMPFAQKDAGWPGVDHYTIDMGQFEDQLHPQLPGRTRLWGYGQGHAAGSSNWTRHLGGIIVATRGVPVQVTFRNWLPPQPILPIDTSIPGADGAANRATVHLHGGKTPWVSDGVPYAWWDPLGNHGESFVPMTNLNPNLKANEAELYYPNAQSARMMWYHDHALGTTRLNAYAGLASAYILTDDYETSLTSAPTNLPGPKADRTNYLVFQDKIFVPANHASSDPTWAQVVPNTKAGDLWYPHEYDPARWELDSDEEQALPTTSVVPEAFGDTLLVNGTVYPYLEVQPREYRFRMLNACNARFLNPRLVYATGTTAPASTEPNPNIAGPALIQIGTEGGFLPEPVVLNGSNAPGKRLLLGPAERADVVVDFRNVTPGSVLILYNDAPAPFPMGDARYDFDPKNPKTPAAAPGYGPNTRTLLQIRVMPRVGPSDPPIALPARFTPTDPFSIPQTPGVAAPNPPNINVRYLTLSEDFDEHGRLIQFLGTNELVNGDFGRAYDAPTTEIIAAGATEIWEIANLTGDTHPIHFHLVNVQVLSRQRFNSGIVQRGHSAKFTPGPHATYLGRPLAPDANELGWKETVRMNPGEVTRVMMKFELPAVPFTVPNSPRNNGTGAEYVWHCHILEHEEHDMMRPFTVI